MLIRDNNQHMKLLLLVKGGFTTSKPQHYFTIAEKRY